jgi:hypothetical protein
MERIKLHNPKLTCYNTDEPTRRTLERLADHFADKEDRWVSISEVYRRAVAELARKERVEVDP